MEPDCYFSTNRKLMKIELYTVLILAAWPVSVLIPYTGTGRSVFRSVFPGVSKILADVMV